MPALVDGNLPTQEEVITHNMKVAKANLACDIVKFSVGSQNFFGSSGPVMTPDDLVRYAVGVAEGIIETYSMMPDAMGKRGGLIS